MGTTAGQRAVRERRGDVDGWPVFWREADSTAPPVLYLHGVPTSSRDWLPFLALTGGVAPDLPGFGRSGKRGDFDFSIAGYDTFLERFLDVAGVSEVSLVVHDWGAVGLALAQRMPARVRSLVVINAVPFLPGYRWHRIARMWRRPLVGEVVMGAATRWSLKLISREANATPGPLPTDLLDDAWETFDHGTQRAILGLYRSAPPQALARAGERLGDIACPALVVWGDRDPYIPASFADAYAERLPGGRARHVQDAGHWPWLDRPDLVEEIAAFLARV